MKLPEKEQVLSNLSGFNVSEAEARQQEIYAAADSEIWRQAVYEPLHGGWDLACIAGRPFLNFIISDSALGPQSSVLELGSGAGAACDYLASSSNAAIVGIERNAAQCERARARRSDVRPGSLTFVCADASKWRASSPNFTCAYLLDTLSLVDDWDGMLSAARSALPEGQALYIADQCAGENIQADTLQRAYQLDGFLALRPAAHLREVLKNQRFGSVEQRDANADAIAAFSTMQAALGRLSATPASTIDPDVLAAWSELTDFYLAAFKNRELVYTRTKAW
ncbi:hypothetical protein FIV00_17120 [Labrenzia sp. THAF82]|uniref:class I SAM-dependent methyltransferase n=1 Tax=Labrenzia sp. THAF82 TaxID=2587861 RepID=UPI0012A9A579|nr:class I SAM-dependent methyltransferase [Labrenzia sp. THAF82]QFT32215.1 hypothetical protein FIV00_17120 [Labrenzia sp. THAF82]